MKIGEAQQIYADQVNAYRKQKTELTKQLREARTKMDHNFQSEAATLQLTLDALDEKESEYQKYLDQLAERYCAYWNAEVAEQQKEAGKESAAEMGKIMEVARRIMKGSIVPASDEKKLMEFSMDMYQMAKNIGAMVRQEKKENQQKRQISMSTPKTLTPKTDDGTLYQIRNLSVGKAGLFPKRPDKKNC